MSQESENNYVPRAPRFKVTDTSNVDVTIARTDETDHQPLAVDLVDVSQHGTKLRVPVNLRFEEVLQLKIEVSDNDISYQGVASVRHIRAVDEDHWLVGCAIAPPLSDEAFSFLATTAGKERRRFRRLPTAAEAIVKRQAQTEGIQANLHNLSSGGVCFSSAGRFDRGERVQLLLEGNDGEQRIIEARICWQVETTDGSIAGCQFSSSSSYAELCACLTDQPQVESPFHHSEEPTSKLVLTAAVLAMFVPPMMTLMFQANKVSAEATSSPSQIAESTASAERPTNTLGASSTSEPKVTEDSELLEELIMESQAVMPTPSEEESAQPQTQLREWVDNTGKHRTRAELIEVAPDYVMLMKANGQKAKVPMRRLSAADREYVQQWQANQN